ncbi:MAG: hypothetical protein Q7R77_04545 [Candidatus Daviesbacteria bacterium]|nr:hypothetical protein [Candidatus Daviesbacteria bacterium]
MKISINLLPTEDIAKGAKRVQFYKVQFIGIAVILVMVFLASLTVALRVLQNRYISPYQLKVAASEQQVSDLKSTQASLLLLKDRLKVIDQYLGVSSKQSSMYQLIDKLLPPLVVVNAISIDPAGGVTLVVMVPDSASLDNLINNLTNEEKNENKISEVSMDNLSRGRDGFYRVSFNVKSLK